MRAMRLALGGVLAALVAAGPVSAQDASGKKPTAPAKASKSAAPETSNDGGPDAGKKPDASAWKPSASDSSGAASPPAAGAGQGEGKSLKTAEAAPAVPIPPPEVLLMLVRTTLVALNQANFTGNYTVLHALGTPALQQRNSPADLGQAFAGLRQQNIDLSPTLVLTPQLTEGPVIASDSSLRFKGYFPSQPLQINFAMAFQPVAGRWRVEGLSVAAVPTAGAAAQPAPAAATGESPDAAATKAGDGKSAEKDKK